MGCKLRRSQDWATRAQHEAEQYERNCFLTLTFSDEGLDYRELKTGKHPYDLDVRDWQLFAKRLRQAMARDDRKTRKAMGLPKAPPPKLRFFHVGEYGENGLRPHYHALIFGQDFLLGATTWKDDLGHLTWTHPIIEKCWPYGFHEIKELTPETVNYVAKYVQKKLYGEQYKDFHERIDSQTGECVTVKPEHATMSKGIGAKWWDKYKNEVFPDDFVVVKGKKVPVPRYYTKKLQKENEELYEQVRDERCKSAAGRAADNTPERRLVRDKVTKARIGIAMTRKL